MSEQNSLFAKIHITKSNFDAFLKAKPITPELDNDWVEWWNTRVMYGKADLQQKDLYCYEKLSNESIINGWKEEKESVTFSDYDSEKEIWHFGIIMFSENYYEMIAGFAFLKSVAGFKNENKEDFAIVYNYFWGDKHVCAYITYENGKGVFDKIIQTSSEINLDTLKYTEEYLNKKWDEFAKTRLTDDL